ncbi:MAG: biotin--[acetyl-CoA-carboxylase] ligase [Bacteroidota bacterium]
MNIVKLDAINSTNQFLKDFAKSNEVDNWTVVTAQYQTSGRGQMQTKWESIKNKNLLFSVLIKFEDMNIENQFYMNCAISLGIYNSLLNYKVGSLSVKWPNDIMAENKKIAGILIENTLVKDHIKYAVVGIGLNVNQIQFPVSLPKATSLKLLLDKELNRDILLQEIVNSIKHYINFLKKKEFSFLKEQYEKVLFKIGINQVFENNKGHTFTGKILGINKQGKLLIEEENKEIKEFNFKEIKFL